VCGCLDEKPANLTLASVKAAGFDGFTAEVFIDIELVAGLPAEKKIQYYLG